MRLGQSIVANLLLTPLLLSWAAVAILGGLFIASEVDRYIDETRQIRQDRLARNKSLVKAEVLQAAELVEQNRREAEAEVRRELAQWARRAATVFAHFSSEHPEDPVPDVCNRILGSAMDRGFPGSCFVARLPADCPSGTAGLDAAPRLPEPLRDPGLQEALLTLARQGTATHFTHPRDAFTRGTGVAGYILPLDSCGLVAGSFVRVADHRAGVQAMILERLEQRQVGEHGYFFAATLDGLSLLGPRQGENVWELTGVSGVKIVQELVAAAKSGGGFVGYNLPDPADGPPTPKISYTVAVEDWNWYIGTGVPLAGIEEDIAAARDRLRRDLVLKLAALLVLLVLLALAALVMSRLFAMRMKRHLDAVGAFFRQAAQGEDAGLALPEKVFTEFRELGDMARDMVQQRDKAQADLETSHDILTTVLDNIPADIYVADPKTFRILFMNRPMRESFGGDLTGQLCHLVFRAHPDPCPECPIPLIEQSPPEDASHTWEDKNPVTGGYYLNKDAMIHWIDGRRVKLQIATDISEYRAYQKALIQAHSKYKELFDHAVVGIFQSTPRGRFLNVNPAMASILGYDSPEDLVNRVTDIRAQVYVDPEARDRLHHRLLEPGDRDEQEVQVKRKDGSVIWVAESTRLVRDDFGRVEFYEGFLTDITERRHSQERIQAQLAEKEVLLREIHHRVKNNLQIVSSLLNLQSGKVDHGPLADIITDSRNRILSMALVHEELYRTEDLGRVDLASYVGRLTHRLGSTGPQLEVDIPADTPHMPCSINQAIPSGLIINELVTNAAKHAFAGKEPGLVRIRLERIDGDFRVTVTDNGVGLPESFDPDGTETLGFQLVMNLVRQIDGEFFIRREPESGGSCMGFRFPVQNEDLPG